MPVAALVLGIIGLLFSLVTCHPAMIVFSLPCDILALVFGIVGKNKAAEMGEPTGMAKAGLIMGAIGLGLVLLWIIVWVAGIAFLASNAGNGNFNWGP